MIAEGGNRYTVSYISDDPMKASVSSLGEITALREGKARITVIFAINGVEKSFALDLIIKKAYIKLIKSTKYMKQGKTYTFQAEGYGVDTRTLCWTTSKKSIVIINRNTGLAAAKAVGTDFVVVKSDSIKAQVKVIVK